MKIFETLKIFTDVAEEIIDILMEGSLEEESVRFEIGKKLFLLEEKLLQKKKNLYKIIAEEILKQLPDQEGISPASLSEMKRFYKAKAYFLTKFTKGNR
jgi:hypothetical protein